MPSSTSPGLFSRFDDFKQDWDLYIFPSFYGLRASCDEQGMAWRDGVERDIHNSFQAILDDLTQFMNHAGQSSPVQQLHFPDQDIPDHHKMGACLALAVLKVGPYHKTPEMEKLTMRCRLANELLAFHCARVVVRMGMATEAKANGRLDLHDHYLKYDLLLPKTRWDDSYGLHLYRNLWHARPMNPDGERAFLLWLAHVLYFLEHLTHEQMLTCRKEPGPSRDG